MRIPIDRYPWCYYHGQCDCPRSDRLHLGWIRLRFNKYHIANVTRIFYALKTNLEKLESYLLLLIHVSHCLLP